MFEYHYDVSEELKEIDDFSDDIIQSNIPTRYPIDGPKISITYYPSAINGLWYFSVHDNHALNHNKLSRISMYKPEYIICNDATIPMWILNKEEKETLYKILNMPISTFMTYMKPKPTTAWQFLIKTMNVILENFDLQLVPEDLPMPDYRLLPDKV